MRRLLWTAWAVALVVGCRKETAAEPSAAPAARPEARPEGDAEDPAEEDAPYTLTQEKLDAALAKVVK